MHSLLLNVSLRFTPALSYPIYQPALIGSGILNPISLHFLSSLLTCRISGSRGRTCRAMKLSSFDFRRVAHTLADVPWSFDSSASSLDGIPTGNVTLCAFNLHSDPYGSTGQLILHRTTESASCLSPGSTESTSSMSQFNQLMRNLKSRIFLDTSLCYSSRFYELVLARERYLLPTSKTVWHFMATERLKEMGLVRACDDAQQCFTQL